MVTTPDKLPVRIHHAWNEIMKDVYAIADLAEMTNRPAAEPVQGPMAFRFDGEAHETRGEDVYDAV